MLAAGVGGFWAEAVVVLIYGEAYAPVTNILRWMLFGAGMALGESAFGALLSTTDNQRLRATFAALYLGVSLVAAGLLIPAYGLTGAVIACVGARLLTYGIGLVVVVRMMAICLPWRELGNTLLAAGISAGTVALCLGEDPGPWLGIGAGVLYAVVFLGSSRYLGVWQEKDLRMIASLSDQYPHLLGWTRTYLHRWIAGLQR